MNKTYGSVWHSSLGTRARVSEITRACGKPSAVAVALALLCSSVAAQGVSYWDGGDSANFGNNQVDGGSGSWTAAGSNWTGADGASNAPLGATPGFAVFKGPWGPWGPGGPGDPTLKATVSVGGAGEALAVTGMQFASQGYVLQGGTIALSGLPGTRATIQVGDESAAFYSATVNSVLTGSAALEKTGKGELILTGVNTYSGGTLVQDGAVVAGVTGALGQGPVTVNTNAALIFQGSSSAENLAIGLAAGAPGANGGFVQFKDDSSAGSARFISLDGATVEFRDNASAGSAQFDNRAGGNTDFTGQSSAGTARIENGPGGQVNFLDTASAGHATLINQSGGLVDFFDSSTADSATVVNHQGGTVRIDHLTAPGMAIGALSGAGNVRLGNKALTTGGLGTSTTISGVISGVGGSLRKTGAGTLTLTGANTYGGGTTVTAGTLVGSATSFGTGAIVNNATLELAQAGNGTLSNQLSGNGVLIKSGGGTLLFIGDGTGFTGSMQVLGGTLAANGQLGGMLTVGSGARLRGSGTVGSAHLLSGAVLAPGNSIGLLKVAGDLILDAGASYEIEAQADGQSDRVQVSGKASLGGASAVVLAANGQWNPLTRYSILTAAGGVTGQFATLSSNFAFLTPSLAYSAQEVTLSLLRNDVDFAAVGATANQRAAAAAAQGAGTGALYQTLVQLDAPTARSAFDQLSGEIHASLRTALIEDSRLVRDAATDRLRLAQGGVAVNASQTAQAANGGAGWAQAYGSWGKTDSNGNAAQMDRSTRGLLVGGDQRFGDWRLGAFAGGGRSKVDLHARNASASVNSVHLGLYAGTQWGALGLRSGLAYSQHSIDTARHVAFTGLRDTAQADYDARSTQLFGELGWQMGSGLTTFEPFANLAYVSLKTDGFQERGGISALSASSQRTGTTLTTLGVRASTQWTLGHTPLTARGLLGWRHAMGDVVPSASLAFAGAGAFSVTGAAVAKNAAVLEMGLDMALQRDLTLGLAYSAQSGSHYREQGAKLNLLWKF